MRVRQIAVYMLGLLWAGSQAFGVGIPVSFDVEIYQLDDSTSPSTKNLVFGPTNVTLNVTTDDLDPSSSVRSRHPIGTTGAYASIKVSDSLIANTPAGVDRTVQIQIDTGSWDADPARPSLFQSGVDGDVYVEITHMEWTHTGAESWVQPFSPDWYPDGTVPIFYMLGRDGFLELNGWRDYAVPQSTQITMDDFESGNSHGHVFEKVIGEQPSIILGGIQDPSGVGTAHADAPDVVLMPSYSRIPQGPHDFGDVPEIGISLTYQSLAPEPTTVMLLLIPGVVFLSRRRRGRPG